MDHLGVGLKCDTLYRFSVSLLDSGRVPWRDRCRSTLIDTRVAARRPRRSHAYPLGAVFFTSCKPSCRGILHLVQPVLSERYFANGDPAPLGGRPHHGPDATENVESLLIPCRMSTMGPSMPSGFVTSMEVEASSPSDGRVQRDHPIQNDPSAPILVTSRTPLVVALPLLLTSGDV